MNDAYTERGISRQAELAIREFQQAKAKFIQELHTVRTILPFPPSSQFQLGSLLPHTPTHTPIQQPEPQS